MHALQRFCEDYMGLYSSVISTNCLSSFLARSLCSMIEYLYHVSVRPCFLPLLSSRGRTSKRAFVFLTAPHICFPEDPTSPETSLIRSEKKRHFIILLAFSLITDQVNIYLSSLGSEISSFVNYSQSCPFFLLGSAFFLSV